MASKRTPASWIVEIAEKSIEAYQEIEGVAPDMRETARRRAVSQLLVTLEDELLQDTPLTSDMAGATNIYAVEFRQYLSQASVDEAPPAYSSQIVYIASTIEKAVAWCKSNTAHAPHKSEKIWDFAIRKRTVDAELLGGGLMMVLDWNGEVTGWTV